MTTPLQIWVPLPRENLGFQRVPQAFKFASKVRALAMTLTRVVKRWETLGPRYGDGDLFALRHKGGERFRRRFETKRAAEGYEAYVKATGEEPPGLAEGDITCISGNSI